MSDSPLAEAMPESLAELFARDPLKMSEQDIEKIVRKLASEREHFQALERQGGRQKRVKQEGKVSLEDFGL